MLYRRSNFSCILLPFPAFLLLPALAGQSARQLLCQWVSREQQQGTKSLSETCMGDARRTLPSLSPSEPRYSGKSCDDNCCKWLLKGSERTRSRIQMKRLPSFGRRSFVLFLLSAPTFGKRVQCYPLKM